MISEHKKEYTLFLIVLAVISSVIFLTGIAEIYGELFDRSLYIIIGLSTVFFGGLWIKSYGLKSSLGKTVLLFSMTIFMWVLGDFLWWFVFDEALVSFADVLWLAGYPLMMIGLFFGIHMKGAEIIKEKKKFIFSVIAILVIGFIYFHFFPPVWDPGLSDVENAVTVGYVIADLFLIIPLVVLVIFSLSGGSVFSSVLFGIAILITLANDMLYATSFDTNIYEGIIELISSAIYLLFALAFVYLKPEEEPLAAIPKEEPIPVVENKIAKKTRKSKSKKK